MSVRPQLRAHLRLHLGWAMAAASLLVVGYMIYLSALERSATVARTTNGRWLGALCALLVTTLLAYAMRRRSALDGDDEGVDTSDSGREQQFERLQEAIADVQIIGARHGDSRATIRRAATQAVADAGFDRRFAVGTAQDLVGSWIVTLVPRRHPGRLENWLKGHQYLGVAVLGLVGMHSGFQARSLLEQVLVGTLCAAVGTGLLLTLVNKIVPRMMVIYEPHSTTPQPRITFLTKLMAGGRGVHLVAAIAMACVVLLHVAHRL